MLTDFIGWVLNTLTTAAEAEMNDDTAPREQLLEAEMRREMGEISDEEFQDIETQLLKRIREIKGRREGGGPLEMGGQPIETSSDSRFQVEASVSGDFYEPSDAPHTTIIETEPVGHALGNLVETHGGEQISVMDMEPGQAESPDDARLRRARKTQRRTASARQARTARTIRTTERKIRKS